MFKKTNLTKSILVATAPFMMAFVMTSPAAQASSVLESDFELALPAKFQQSLVDGKWKDLVNQEFSQNWKLPDQIVEADYGIQVHLNDISLAVKSMMEKPDLGQTQTLLHLQSKDLQGQLVIGDVSVDQTILQTVGGVTARVHVQAECKNVTMNMNQGAGSFGLDLTPAVGSSQVAAGVKDVQLSWQPGAWTVAPFTCTGVQGFDHLLTQELNKISQDSASFVNPKKDLLISYVKQYLGTLSLNISTPRELVSSRSDIKMSMVIDSYDDSNPNMVMAKGRITIEFTRITDNSQKKLTLNTAAPAYQASTQAQLRLPADFVKEVMTRAYAANTWVHQLNSSTLPGFSSVMGSRFTQFFIWPELMNYSKSAKFLFDVYSAKNPSVSGKGLQYNVSMNLLSRMQAPQNSSYVPFMNFTIPFSSQVSLGVSSGKASVAFKNVDLTLKYQWDQSYVNKYSPSTRFGASTIQSRILSSLEGQTTSFTLPAIPLMNDVNLKVNKAQTLSNSDLLLQLAP